MAEGKRELCTESNCEHCRTAFRPKNRNGLKVRFCTPKCSRAWHNAQRLKGAALLKAKSITIKGPRKTAIRTMDQLAASQGLPAGCYPAGALGQIGRRSVAAVIPAAERPALLVEAAKRLGLTEEGPILKAARLAAQRTATLTGDAA